MKNKKIIGYSIAVLILIISFFIDKHILIPKHAAIDYAFESIFDFITIFTLFILIGAAFLYEEKKKKWILPLFISAFVTIIITISLKMIIARTRPDIAAGIMLNDLFIYSFPSLHTSLAFSALPILNRKFKKIKWFWIVFAVVVGISRIYFNQHFFSDVVGGALLGYTVGDIFFSLEKKYKW